jgi:serine/threonine protein kinase/Tfp pilus assembly protein PilF
MSDPDGLIREDALFGDMLVRQGLCTPERVAEGLDLLRRLSEQGVRPLPRLGMLLLQKGYLGSDEGERTQVVEEGGATLRRIREGEGLPEEAAAATADPANRIGKYVRTRLLGVGGMGEVWKAWDRELGRWAALKFLKHEDPREASRFKAEAQTAARLNHPNICPVYEVGRHESRPFIALQYVEGRTLAAFRRGERLELVRIAREAASALHHAHENGVVHRDVKPANIMVTPRGEVFVMDFGLAKANAVDSSVSVSGSVVGTPAYMSPEQARGAPDLDGRADVYSLGATLYELFSGAPLYQGSAVYDILVRIAEEEPAPLRRKVPGFDAELDTIVLKCLEKDPARRYVSAAELAEDLRRWTEREPILAHPPSAFYRLRKRLAKRKAVAGLACVVAAAAAGLLAIVPAWRRASLEETELAQILRVEQSRGRQSSRAREAAQESRESGRRILAQLERRLGSGDCPREELLALAGQAAQHFERSLAEYSLNPEALLGLARLRELTGDHEGAVTFAGRAIQVSPDFATAYLDRIRLLLPDYESLRHALTGEDRPESSEAKTLRERIQEDLRAVERHAHVEEERRFARALASFCRGDHEAAVKALDDVIQAWPTDEQAHGVRGHALLHLGRLEEAEEALTQSLRYDARNLFVLKDRAGVRVRRGRLDEALSDLEDILAKEPASVFGLLQRGLIRQRRGDLKGAAEDFEKSLVHRLTWQGYLNAGLVSLAQGNARRAIELMSAALPLSDDRKATGVILRYLALSKWKLRDAASAADMAGRALRVDAGDVTALAVRGQARRDLGDAEGARQDLRRALELAPEDFPDRGALEETLKSIPP